MSRRVHPTNLNQNGMIRFMPGKKKAGTVRLDEPTRAEVDQYASNLGIDYNAAMNILVRVGLRTATKEPK